ncbi:MAG: protein jag [Anaerolineales bacterium]|nr:protein jag [Anaerolineales bacterium]
MTDHNRSVEVTGATTEDAIESGLAQLGVMRDQVTIDVLREPSRGVLGIGARDAVVKLTVVKLALTEKTEPAKTRLEPVSAPPIQPVFASHPKTESDQALTQEDILKLAQDILAELLEKMQIEADIEARIDNPKFSGDESALILDLQGKDLGFLIGRKGSTLAAIQHITRLIVNKSTQQRTNLIVDVEGYKVRREHALKKLALRIADKATKRNRRIALEPMNAYERRIIHLTLRNHPTVTTESVGDKDRRKVTILPRS